MSIADLLAEFRDPDTGEPRANVTLAWELRVAGMGEYNAATGNARAWRWVDSPKPADTDDVRYFEALDGRAVSNYTSRFDGVRGLVAAGGTRVHLTFIDEGPHANKVGELCRVDPEWEARATASVYSDTAAPFDLAVSSTSNFDAGGGIFHMGQETFVYDSIDAGAGTVHVTQRAVLDTPQQTHLVDAARGWSPIIRSHVCVWRDRPAELWKTVVTRLTAGYVGRHPQLMQHNAGYLVGLASHDALKASIVITPWSAALERKIGAKDAVARLQDGWKVFDPDDPGIELVFEEHYPDGAWDAAFAYPVPEGDRTELEVDQQWIDAHEDLFDQAAPAGDARRGLLRFVDENDPDAAAAAIVGYDSGPTGGMELDRPGPAGVLNFGIRSVEARVIRRLDLRDSEGTVTANDASGIKAVPWPRGPAILINKRLRPRAAQTASARAGHIPGFLDIRLDPSNLMHGPSLHVLPTADRQAIAPRLDIRFGDANRQWYGIDLAAPDDPVHAMPIEQASTVRWPRDRLALRIPGIRSLGYGSAAVVPIRRIKAGHYQTGQRFILVDRGDIWPGGTFGCDVRWREGDEEHRRRIFCSFFGAASTILADVPGFLLEVRDGSRWRIPSFGDDYKAGKVTTIQPVASWAGFSATDLMLQLLTSTDGRGSNGAYDVLPAGAGIPLASIDVQSFTSYPDIGGVTSSLTESVILSGKKLIDMIGPLLGLLNAQVRFPIDLETGRRRVKLERAGFVDAEAGGQAVILDGQWDRTVEVEERPDQDVVNAFRYRFNHGPDGKPTAEVTIADRDAIIDQRGRDDIRTEEIIGLRLPSGPVAQASLLLPSAMQRLAAYSRARPVIKGRVDTSRAVDWDAGMGVQIYHDDVRSRTGARVIAGEFGRIIELVDETDQGKVRIAVEMHGAGTRPLAPTLRVTAAPNATTVTVDRHKYALSINPFTGAEQRAVDLFRVGQTVQCRRRGSRTKSGLITITSINRDTDTVVFDGAHNLVGPQFGTVDLPTYAFCDAVDQATWMFYGRGFKYG